MGTVSAKLSTEHKRFHGLDALRAVAMSLGILLHATLPYFDTSGVWPSQGTNSTILWGLFEFIHIWRMPLFFVLSGFFAGLIVQRRSWRAFQSHRVRRIALPLLIFAPLIAFAMPHIFSFGWVGNFTDLIYPEIYFNPWHLWFLIYVLWFVLLMSIWRIISSVFSRVIPIVGKSCHSPVKSSLTAFFSKVPLLFVITLVILMILLESTELHENSVVSFAYFLFGYGLYSRQNLIEMMKQYSHLYLAVGTIGFALYLYIAPQVTKIYTSGQEDPGLGLLYVILKGTCAVTFSFGLIGLAEAKIRAKNDKVRLIADSSYWIYLIHLPIVTLISFAMFKSPLPAEIKFLIAVSGTSTISFITYQLFVRKTFVGVLLNGRRL